MCILGWEQKVHLTSQLLPKTGLMENTSTRSPREKEHERALDAGSLISDDLTFKIPRDFRVKM